METSRECGFRSLNGCAGRYTRNIRIIIKALTNKRFNIIVCMVAKTLLKRQFVRVVDREERGGGNTRRVLRTLAVCTIIVYLAIIMLESRTRLFNVLFTNELVDWYNIVSYLPWLRLRVRADTIN